MGADTDGETEGSGPDDDDATDPGTESGGETEGDPDGELQIPHSREADILLVVDDSASMGEVQAVLAKDIGALVDMLDARSVDYRIGITTTDNGNVWCRGGSSSPPEAGNFVFSSCRSRLPDFSVAGMDASHACEDFCPPAWGTIEQTPTIVEGDPVPRRRPWLENTAGATNLPEGLDVATALRCLVPQGVNGCGFEAHLESMYKGLRRTEADGEDELGFLRSSAALGVLFVSDEADCSYSLDAESIFLPATMGGNEVFWSLPGEPTPTSAVCWNAGVACTPDGAGIYDDCSPQDKDIDGNPTTDPDAAVLLPVSRYAEFLQEVEDVKNEFAPALELVVAAIDGVPESYPNTPIVYGHGSDPMMPGTFDADFGIGPGCSSMITSAVPPVRMRALAEVFADPPALSSVCSASYADAITAFADAVADQLPPGCVRACVADVDPVMVGVTPSCEVTQHTFDAVGTPVETAVAPCGPSQSLPDDADVCWVARTDQDGVSPDPNDDMSDACVDEGWNLEIAFVRRDGVPAPDGTTMGASCELSSNRPIDCPSLP